MSARKPEPPDVDAEDGRAGGAEQVRRAQERAVAAEGEHEVGRAEVGFVAGAQAARAEQIARGEALGEAHVEHEWNLQTPQERYKGARGRPERVFVRVAGEAEGHGAGAQRLRK